jgi:hypothetical protein
MTAVDRCDKHDMVLRDCAECSPRNAAQLPYISEYRWIKFGPDAILISRPGSGERIAHIPGACDHHTEADVLDTKNSWGWVDNPEPGTWLRISRHAPLGATGGNLDREADRRCHDCARKLLT